MRLKAGLALLAAALLVAALWRLGVFAALAAEAVAIQRAMQSALAAAVYALRADEPWALAWLMGPPPSMASPTPPGRGTARR